MRNHHGARRGGTVRTTVATIALAAILAASTGGGARADGDGARETFAKAWLALEADRDPAAAARGFERVASDAAAPRELRARALLGLARCERMRGDAAAADQRLRTLVETYADLGAVVAEARQALSQGAGSRTRFMTGVVTLAPGQALDLDTGGVFAGASTFDGHLADVVREPKALRLPADHARDDAIATKLPVWSTAPWERVTTDEGRTAWVQVLTSIPAPVVRFVTRTAGVGDVVWPSPDPAFAYAADPASVPDAALHVRFRADPAFVRYRVERRVGVRGAFEPAIELPEPQLVIRDAQADVRYGFRVTGIAADGSEGIPAFVQASRSSRGIVSGTCVLSRATGKNGFDLLANRLVPEADADVVLTGTYGGGDGASFTGGDDRPVVAAIEGGAALTTPWAAPRPEAFPYVPAGGWFVGALRGGGIFRARWSVPSLREGEARLDYEANPDAPVFPEGPRLVAERVPEGVRLKVEPPAGFDVREVRVRTLDVEGPERTIAVEGGAALDKEPALGHLTRYAATGVDAYGRRGTEGEAVWNDLPRGVAEGRFKFHYQQGFSIERRALVPLEDADVIFSSCAGGISSVELTAPGGIVNLEAAMEARFRATAVGKSSARRDVLPVRTLFASVRGVLPESLHLARTARGDDRRPESDVFVVRTRHGGWARLAIVGRGTEGGWTDHLVTVLFAYNAFEPVLGEATSDATEAEGILLADPAAELARARERAVVGLKDGIRRGEFRFHYRQGWSLEQDGPAGQDEADVFFQSAAGGISSVTLEAPGGVVSLADHARNLQSRALVPPPAGAEWSPRALLAGVQAADPDKLRLQPRVNCDDRTPLSDVLLLRTRNGAWAKLAIVGRASGGSWSENDVTIAYVLSRDEPVFEAPGPALIRGSSVAIDLDAMAQAAAAERRSGGAARAPNDGPAGPPVAGGTFPKDANVQEVLYARRAYGDYEKATFSFRYGVRDDPGLARTHNDWDVEYGNDGDPPDMFEVNTVTDDASTITDLGRLDWSAVTHLAELAEGERDRAEVRLGHVYLIRTEDTDSYDASLLRVTAHAPQDRVAFEWVTVSAGRFSTSPGLAVPPEDLAAIERLLRALLAEGGPILPDPDAVRFAAAARDTRMQLHRIRLTVAWDGVDVKDAFRILSTQTTGNFILAPDVQGRISLATSGTAVSILNRMARLVGFRWEITDQGLVRVIRAEKPVPPK